MTETDQQEEEDSQFIASETIVVIQDDDGDDDTPKVVIESDSAAGVPARYTFSMMGFLAFFLIYSLRTCPNVAMVAMVNSTALAENYINNNNSSNSNITSASKNCPGSSESGDEDGDYVEGDFAWSEQTQGLILGAFYYSYALLQVLGGWLAERVRAKWLMGAGLLLSSLLSLTLPSAARAGSSWMMAVRVLQGVVEVCGVPLPPVFCGGMWCTPLCSVEVCSVHCVLWRYVVSTVFCGGMWCPLCSVEVCGVHCVLWRYVVSPLCSVEVCGVHCVLWRYVVSTVFCGGMWCHPTVFCGGM
ncbi:hypothetical protein ACOMHN_004758 [Nucella lapillus]